MRNQKSEIENRKCRGTVYLVGAGPGDHGLITVRALDCIRDADVIVYDRLANPVILNNARPDAELVYVGKSSGRHTMRQDEINETLVRKAAEGKSVVRLKGGDPFVFGRGGEEAVFLSDNGIGFEIIPGVSSALAAPAYAGIPVTHRDMASSFAVITGHEAADKETDATINWAGLAAGCDTLVFLMGMGNLPSIVGNLVDNGRDPSEPVALIQWGTTPEQRCLIGNLSDIVEKAAQADFTPPTIILVGNVASLAGKLTWFGGKLLSGKRVMITRPRHQSRELADAIEDLGGEAYEFPTIEIAPPSDYSPMDDAIANIEGYSWLVFTSINGVSAFFDRMRHLKRDIRSLKGVNVCVIGSKTKGELERRGLVEDYIPESYTSQALADGLKDRLDRDDNVLIPRVESAPDVFSSLKDMGFRIHEVPAYRTVRGSGNVQIAREMFHERKIHILTFTSSSTVTNFVDMLSQAFGKSLSKRGNEDNLGELLEDVIVVCIGPVTAKTARDLGIPVHVVASEYTIEGMIASILKYIAG